VTTQDAQNKKKRIVVVDDHSIVRRGFIYLIEDEPDMEVCGEAEDAPQAIDVIAAARPDLAIIDIALKTSSGIDLIKQLRGQFPTLSMLVVSMHDEILYAERALHAGARGYIMKQEADEKMVHAIRRVLDGGVYVSEKMTERLLNIVTDSQRSHPVALVETLSDRELEVFRMIGRGAETRQIAEALNVGFKTVATYRERIKKKLNLDSASQLIQCAVEYVVREGGA